MRDQPIGALLVAYHFPPSIAVGGLRMRRFVEHLPAEGIRPYVLTIDERAGESFDPATDPRYRGEREQLVRVPLMTSLLARSRQLRALLPRRAVVDGDAAPPAPAPPRGAPDGSHEASDLTARALLTKLLVFPDAAFSAWFVPAVRAGLRTIRAHDLRVMLTSGPPHSSHLVGVVLQALTGARLVTEYRDPWTHEHAGDPVARLAHRLEAMAMRASAAVVSVTPQMTARLRARYPALPAERFVSIPNAVDVHELPPPRPPGGSDRFTLIHAGSLYDARDPRPLFAGLRRFLDRDPARAATVRLELLGADADDDVGPDDLRRLVERERLAEIVTIEGRVPRGEVLERSSRADVFVILAQHQPTQIPGKLYEAVALGRPVLAVTGEGATREALLEAGGAEIVEGDDPEVTADALERLWRARATGVGDATRARQQAFMGARRPEVLARQMAQVLRAAASAPARR